MKVCKFEKIKDEDEMKQVINYNPQIEMFRPFKTKSSFPQIETYFQK